MSKPPWQKVLEEKPSEQLKTSTYQKVNPYLNLNANSESTANRRWYLLMPIPALLALLLWWRIEKPEIQQLELADFIDAEEDGDLDLIAEMDLIEDLDVLEMWEDS